MILFPIPTSDAVQRLLDLLHAAIAVHADMNLRYPRFLQVMTRKNVWLEAEDDVSCDCS